MKLLRVLVIILSFIVDVKVRASTTSEWIHFENKNGKVEIENIGETSADVETFKKASTTICVGHNKFTLKEKTFVTVSEKNVRLHKGTIYFIQSSDRDMKIATSFGDFKGKEKSEYLVTVSGTTATVSVLFGTVMVSDRLQKESWDLDAGYRQTLGELKSNGKRYVGSVESVSYEESLSDIQQLGTSEAGKSFKPTWEKAVKTVALETQSQVDEDMRRYVEWMVGVKKRELASQKERDFLIKKFRAHALDLPLKSTEDPSE